MEFGERQRRMLRRACAAFLTIFVGAVLTACATPAPKPSPTPTSTAIFASEEEALAAATDTYQQYTAALDVVYAEGGVDVSPIQQFVTNEYWTTLREDRTLVDRGWRAIGVSSFDTMAIIESDLDSPQSAIVTTVCRDVTDVRLVDGSGVDVTPPTRRDRYPLTITFRPSQEEGADLLIAQSDPWTGDDPC